LYYYPSIAEQLSCEYMGCGAERSRIAFAIYDGAIFLRSIKYDVKTAKRGLEDGTVQTLEFYAEKLQMLILNDLHRYS